MSWANQRSNCLLRRLRPQVGLEEHESDIRFRSRAKTYIPCIDSWLEEGAKRRPIEVRKGQKMSSEEDDAAEEEGDAEGAPSPTLSQALP